MAMESLIKPPAIYGYTPAELGQMWAKSKDPQEAQEPQVQMEPQVPQAKQVPQVPTPQFQVLQEAQDQMALLAQQA
jgi:hypothetical protein